MDKQTMRPLKRMTLVIGLVALILLIVGIVKYEIVYSYIVDLMNQMKK